MECSLWLFPPKFLLLSDWQESGLHGHISFIMLAFPSLPLTFFLFTAFKGFFSLPAAAKSSVFFPQTSSKILKPIWSHSFQQQLHSHYPFPTVFTFFINATEYLPRSNCKEEGLILIDSSGEHGPSRLRRMGKEGKVAGHTEFTLRSRERWKLVLTSFLPCK